MDAVIFDLGGVVLEWVPERAFEQVVDAAEVPRLMERIGFHEWNRGNDGRDSLAAAEDELVSLHPGDEVAIRGYRSHFAATLTGMVPGTGAVIAELGQAGVPTTALTNWSGELFPYARQRFGILGRFRDIVVSGREGVIKPDPRIFAIACERAGFEPAATVFVDDSPANVAAARAFGLHGLHFRTADALRDDLVALGLLPPRRSLSVPVYHWAPREEWERALATGSYTWSGRGLGYDAEGFVHLSFAGQLTRTRERFYSDLADDDLVLLRLEPDGLPIVVEDGFPHLFAPLPLERATQVSAPA